ncbi:MAG: transglutaminase-like domain-containing protein [Myxococcota bacterium]
MSDAPEKTGLRAHLRLGVLAHALLLAIAFIVLARPIARVAGLSAGAFAACAGAVAAEILTQARYRLWFALVFPVLVGLALAGLGSAVAGSYALSSALGPITALFVREVLVFFGLAFAAATALRAVAIRFRAALAIEGSIVVLAVAATVAAHRDGMIARPLEVSDFFWTLGLDPVVAFLGIGLFAALLLAGILAYGRAPGRTIAELLLVLVVGFLLAWQIRSRDISEHRDVLGKAGQSKQEKEERDKAQREHAGGGSGGAKGQSGQGDKAGGDKDGSPDDLLPPRGGGSGENRPAAVVVFHRGVTPSDGYFYFRTASFSQWNGSRLVETSRGDADVEVRTDFPVEKTELAVPGAKAEERTEVAVDVAVLVDHRRPFALTDTTEIEPLPNPEPARFRRAYRLVASVLTAPYQDLFGREPGDPKWPEELWAYYTDLPKDERYHRLAAEIRAGIKPEYQDDPIAMAMGVKQYLEENATYSFSQSYEGEEDPTAAFLFSEEKKGYCVHLAHSAAYLLRAMGLPMRVSAGYAVSADNLGGGSSLLIKQGDAHAWAEMYLAGVGWVPIEVAPQKSDVPEQQFAEKDLQQLLGEMARKEGRNSREQMSSGSLRKALELFLAALPWALLALVAAAYFAKLWRILVPYLAPRRHQPRVAYRAALDRLSAVGVVRNYGESREHFAARTQTLAPTFGRLTMAHVGVAFGSARARTEAEPLAPLAASVGREARTKIPWWRWLLGILNPVSWLFSR